MRTRLLTLLATFASSSVLLVGLAPIAHAQQNGSGLAISPPSYELSANPGDALTNSIRVDNTQNQSLDVTVNVRNFTALGEEGEVNLTDQDSTYSLAKWITVTPSSATIAAGQSQVFQYTVQVPSNAEPGGRFGSIVFKTSAKPIIGQSGVSIGQEIGSLIFLKIAGNVTERSSIVGFQTADKINQYKPVNFTLRLKNDGNVHIKPTGTITVTNFFGKKVATIPLDSHNVLPGAIRRMEAQWKDGRFIFGKYTATASVTYGSDKQIITASTSFWGLPYTIMLVCLGALILIGLGLYRARRRIRLALRALSGKS
jgi:hypothetical protein